MLSSSMLTGIVVNIISFTQNYEPVTREESGKGTDKSEKMKRSESSKIHMGKKINTSFNAMVRYQYIKSCIVLK